MRAVGSEEDLSFMLARYMQLQYPNVLYHFDFGSGTKLTMGQAVKNKKLNKRAWPDLFIAQTSLQGVTYYSTEPNIKPQKTMTHYHGLFIELKKEGTKIYLKDGMTLVANEHVREQALTLQALRIAGYKAEFAVGYDQAVKLISEYLA